MGRRKILSSITSRYQNRVRECRLRALIPRQGDLANRTGISRSTINALENNRLFLSSSYALRIAEVLECRLDDLYAKRDVRVYAPERNIGRGD